MSLLTRRRAIGLAAPLVAAAIAAPSAVAAPQNGPTGEAFYTPPTNVPAAGTPGELVRYRQKSIKLTGAPLSTTWDVMYRSTDAKGNPNFVTGTIITPKASVSGKRTLISYAPGTQGLAKACAPSKQLVRGTEYEGPNLIAALKAGNGVLITDYAGYTTTGKPTYLAGRSQGHAVLDIAKAVRQLPNATSISGNNPVAIWGYSQGGQSAGFAGELAPTYAPDLNLIGVAAGGVPADFKVSARNLDRNAGAAFLLGAVLGLKEQYPEIPYDTLINSAGRAAATDAERLCTFALFNKYGNFDINTFTEGDVDINDLINIPSVSSVLDDQKLGTKKINVPVFQYHGAADQVLPLGQAFQAKRDWCAKGSRVAFELYPGEHLTTQFQGAANALKWIADRAKGVTAPSTCAKTTAPTDTSETPGGDHIVNLDKWNLTGAVSLAKLRQSLNLPDGSTFSGAANLTKKQLTGGLDVPSFFTTIKLVGLNIRTSLKLVPTGDIQGTIALDDNGNISIRANAPVIIRVESLQLGLINLGTNCRTERGVQIPLSFDGPVSALGTTGLTFTPTATFPNMTDCGAYGPLLSALISGSGNKFKLYTTAPAPVSW